MWTFLSGALGLSRVIEDVWGPLFVAVGVAAAASLLVTWAIVVIRRKMRHEGHEPSGRAEEAPAPTARVA